VPIKNALVRTYGDLVRNHTLQMAAALAYYFVLSLFPALILLSAVVAYLPIPDLFNQALAVMARFLPGDSMGLVRRVLSDVITPNRGTFLSFGILGTLWAASGGFSAAIEALNIAYEVDDDRPFWKTKPLALGLAFMTGALLLIALSVMVVGPRFGEWLAGRVHLSGLFVLLWPYIHWTIAVGFTNAARCGSRCKLLDRLVVFARYIFSPVCKLQQDLRHPWRCNCPYGVAVLDWLCHVGGSGTQRRVGEDKPRGQAARKA
jgi:uncharacterized BrkB/YihY/UPF0761 family membrane protein